MGRDEPRDHVFPAYAGMSRALADYQAKQARFPRLRGDEPQRVRIAIYDITFSPPTRG